MGAIHKKVNNASDYFRIEKIKLVRKYMENVWPNS